MNMGVDANEFLMAKNACQRLTVSHLKNILRSLNLRVVGKKADLQARLFEAINSWQINTLENQKLKLAFIDQLKTMNIIPSNSTTINSTVKNTLIQNNFNTPVKAVESVEKVEFNTLPGVDVVLNLCPPKLIDCRIGNSVKHEFTLSSTDIPNLMHSNKTNVNCFLYVGELKKNPITLVSIIPEKPIAVQFHPSFQIFVNSQHIPANKYLTVKKKRMIYQPLNITSYLHLRENANNRVEIRFNAESSKYVMKVALVKKISTSEQSERLKNSNFVSKEILVKALQQKALEHQDDDLIATSNIISLRDPITMSKIVTPARSKECNHDQCFDLETYLMYHDSAQEYNCPVCSKTLSWQNIFVDGLFLEILNSVDDEVDTVDLLPDGTWSFPKSVESGNSSNILKGDNGETKIKTEAEDSDEDDVVKKNEKNSSINREETSVNEEDRYAVIIPTTKSNTEIIDLTLDSDDEVIPNPSEATTAPPLGKVIPTTTSSTLLPSTNLHFPTPPSNPSTYIPPLKKQKTQGAITMPSLTTTNIKPTNSSQWLPPPNPNNNTHNILTLEQSGVFNQQQQQHIYKRVVFGNSNGPPLNFPNYLNQNTSNSLQQFYNSGSGMISSFQPLPVTFSPLAANPQINTFGVSGLSAVQNPATYNNTAQSNNTSNQNFKYICNDPPRK
ncbi:SUMO ligase siz1 [Lobulomyces angularis]|nr:SUMO ligase siz1 [Lobulomyces angularis]